MVGLLVFLGVCSAATLASSRSGQAGVLFSNQHNMSHALYVSMCRHSSLTCSHNSLPARPCFFPLPSSPLTPLSHNPTTPKRHLAACRLPLGDHHCHPSRLRAPALGLCNAHMAWWHHCIRHWHSSDLVQQVRVYMSVRSLRSEPELQLAGCHHCKSRCARTQRDTHKPHVC